jgi:hypothetical protein
MVSVSLGSSIRGGRREIGKRCSPQRHRDTEENKIKVKTGGHRGDGGHRGACCRIGAPCGGTDVYRENRRGLQRFSWLVVQRKTQERPTLSDGTRRLRTPRANGPVSKTLWPPLPLSSQNPGRTSPFRPLRRPLSSVLLIFAGRDDSAPFAPPRAGGQKADRRKLIADRLRRSRTVCLCVSVVNNPPHAAF